MDLINKPVKIFEKITHNYNALSDNINKELTFDDLWSEWKLDNTLSELMENEQEKLEFKSNYEENYDAHVFQVHKIGSPIYEKIKNSNKITLQIFENEKSIWANSIVIKLGWSKVNKRYFINCKINKQWSISKINDVHTFVSYSRKKAVFRRLGINNTLFFDSIIRNNVNIPDEIKNKLVNYVYKSYKWVSDLNLPREIVNITQIKKKNITGVNDLYHKMYNYIPKNYFMQCIKDRKIDKIKLLNLCKVTDNKSLEFIDALIDRNFDNDLIKNKYNLDYYTVFDTCNIAINYKLLINLKWSAKRWKQEHDNYVIYQRNKQSNIKDSKLKIAKVFKDFHKEFSKTDYFKQHQYELLDTTRKLYLEGQVQSHCVGGYYDSVNNGACVIYTAMFDNKVTFQISPSLIINQAKYKFNKCFNKVDEFNKILNSFVVNNDMTKYKINTNKINNRLQENVQVINHNEFPF